MKILSILFFFLSFSIFAVEDVLIRNTVDVHCDQGRAMVINMSSFDQARISCQRVGGGSVGETCETDSNCSSHCCQASTGTCGPHIPSQNIFCSKAPGQTCASDTYCRQESINQCFIVKTGRDSFGNMTCTLRCYHRMVHGSCTEGVCLPPTTPPVPPFDPSNPDCSRAIDPPTFP